MDDLSQNEQTFVNINALFGCQAGRPREALLLRAGQVDQLQAGDRHVRVLLQVGRLDRQRENGVAATAELVQIMAGQHFVLRTVLEQFKRLIRTLALEHIQVFDDKLVLLRPPDAQALLRGVVHQRIAGLT